MKLLAIIFGLCLAGISFANGETGVLNRLDEFEFSEDASLETRTEVCKIHIAIAKQDLAAGYILAFFDDYGYVNFIHPSDCHQSKAYGLQELYRACLNKE